ncbi:MAG: anthranilate synthase component I family protein [Nitrospirae bacterium YQR-1]
MPDKRAFLDIAEKGRIPPLYKEVPYKRPAAYYAGAGGKNSFLLESVKGNFNIARYSYAGFAPYLIVIYKDSTLYVESDEGVAISFKNPLNRLRELIEAYPQHHNPELPPFQGGACGMFSYDFVRYLEKIPKTATDDLKIPDAHFFMVDRVLSFDHKERKAWFVLCPGVREYKFGFNTLDVDPGVLYDKSEEEVERFCCSGAIKDVPDEPEIIAYRGAKPEILTSTDAKKLYMDMVKRTLEYIKAGDIFQANLSQRISTRINDVDSWQIYLKLSAINPSPFACYYDFDKYSIVSSSPERLVRVSLSDGINPAITDTRPIAGTRPRGRDFPEDEKLKAELLLNEKERAEHIMLIDLERNDIGRVCSYGSVKVDEMMITETYSHVIHIVSNVTGTLMAGKDCFDVIRAVFPGGTITGVPKVRCMEIIDELEPVLRGPYTGSCGYIGYGKNMDLNIIIRTFVVKDGFAHLQAGAGIVADSVPEREYFETLKKAEALLLTIRSI